MIVRNLEAIFSFNYNPKKLKKATDDVDKFADKIKLAIGGIASLATVYAINNFLADTAARLDQISKNAGKLGVAEEALQELGFAAEQSGVSTESLDKAIEALTRRSSEAASGTGMAVNTFKELGISVTDSAGRLKGPVVLMDEIADAMAGVTDQGHRVRFAIDLFSRQGAPLVNMLQGGSANLGKLKQEARDLGFVMGKDATDKAANFNDAMNRMRRASRGLSDSLAGKLMPSFTTMANFSAGLVASFKGVESSTSVLRVVLLTLGGVAIAVGIKLFMAFWPTMVALSPMIFLMMKIFLVISILALVIDDLWTAFTGGESVIGTLYAKIKSFFSNIAQAVSKGLSDALESAKNEFAKFKAWLTDLGASIKKFFSNIFDGAPDFLKKGLNATLKMIGVSGGDERAEPSPKPKTFNERLAPITSSVSQNRYSNNQNVSVAVNVKSGADPKDISAEVSRAMRKELERERFNAFMGVQHA